MHKVCIFLFTLSSSPSVFSSLPPFLLVLCYSLNIHCSHWLLWWASSSQLVVLCWKAVEGREKQLEGAGPWGCVCQSLALPASSLLPVHQEMKNFFCHKLCCYDLLCFRAKRLVDGIFWNHEQKKFPPPPHCFPRCFGHRARWANSKLFCSCIAQAGYVSGLLWGITMTYSILLPFLATSSPSPLPRLHDIPIASCELLQHHTKCFKDSIVYYIFLSLPQPSRSKGNLELLQNLGLMDKE